MSLPFTDQQCFFVAILVFIVIGFQRGWRRELVSLVFTLLAVFIVRPDSSKTFGTILGKMPVVIGYLFGTPIQPSTTATVASATQVTPTMAPFWSLLIFGAIVILGYYIGNKAFPKPATPFERFIGIVPAVISGAFILAYLTSNYFKNTNGRPGFTVAVQAPDPTNYVPLIFVIAIIAVVIGLIASRAKKAAPKR